MSSRPIRVFTSFPERAGLYVLVASLIYRISHPRPTARSTTSNPPTYLPADKVFASWINHLTRPFVRGTGKHLFRLLFPNEGTRRRYGLKELTLARELGKVLCVNGLEKWDSVAWDGGLKGGTGCLGNEVEMIVKNRTPAGTRSTITIREVDQLLDALASSSAFSQLSQPCTSTLSTTQILTKLYRESSLSPHALAVLTQIILRDLRPLLNPLPQLPIRNPTAMLAVKSNVGPPQLGLLPALRVWDGKMAELYRGGKGSVDWCADKVDELGGGPGGKCRSESVSAGPIVGVNVQIPKCEKGRSVESALNEFCGSRFIPAASVVWAETKYDGYRMQIHVEIHDGQPTITIFSKSKRNSTIDRGNTHSIILASLGLPILPGLPRHPALASRVSAPISPLSRSIILEAEVVPYNEGERVGQRGAGIEEFWCLDSAGVIASVAPGFRSGPSRERETSRHLCLVYFDILHLNGENLLLTPYSRRREILESAVRPIEGFSLLCERTPVPLHLGRATALAALNAAFAAACHRREEGIILKSAESTYNSPSSHRWVKLKKDYIPNLGDCVDLVILGAGWDIDRARELRVDTSVYTTWYVGVLTNGDKVRKRAEAPHFEVISRVSYGGSRTELDMWNANIRMRRWSTKPFDKDDAYKRCLLGLSWTYFFPKSMAPPSALFEQPLCAEIMGAGFQKLPTSELYEVRWPRLQKIYNPRERPWSEALDAPALIRTAHISLGYISPRGQMTLSSHLHPSPEDSISVLWRTASSFAIDVLCDTPSPHSPCAAPSMIKRVKSAPDLTEILKLSPPTPRRARISGMRASPMRIRRSPLAAPGRRMMDAMQAFGAEMRLSTAACGITDVRGNMRITDHTGLGTPISSPAKRLGSPICSPSPPKRSHRASSPHRLGNPTQLAQYLRTPPPTSPVLSCLDINAEGDVQELTEKQRQGGEGGSREEQASGAVGKANHPRSRMPVTPAFLIEVGKKPWKKGQAMSLKSRVKMAMRGMAR